MDRRAFKCVPRPGEGVVVAGSVPVVREVSWRVALPSLVIVTAAAAFGFHAGGPLGTVIAAACYLVYSNASRAILLREHRRGMRHLLRQQFTDAVPHFERSFAFFTRHRWIDAGRGLVMLSSSKSSYREMALLNLAFCYAHLGDVTRTVETYRRCLELFPASDRARAAVEALSPAAPAS